MADPRAASRGTNFALAFRALPPDQREAIRAVHAFSREVDDSVDEEPDQGKVGAARSPPATRGSLGSPPRAPFAPTSFGFGFRAPIWMSSSPASRWT
jgi:hypothetical protein